MKAIAQIFKNGGSQAVRLPKEFRFPSKSVTIEHAHGGVFIKSADDRELRLQKAAKTYEAFLRDNPEEQAAMEAWESAALAEDIKPAKRIKPRRRS